jgi:hypothetical protein
MNPEEQRIAIAQACGWKLTEVWTGELFGKPRGEQGPFREVPDYLNDLNAMHEAERHIETASDQMTYSAEILKAMGLNVSIEDDINVDYCWHACRATAAQRAEAFLKTLNPWKP